MSLLRQMTQIATSARLASYQMALVKSEKKKTVLMAMADAFIANTQALLKANDKDLKEAKIRKYSNALIDRLTLNKKRVEDMAMGVRQTARLKDPIGVVLSSMKRPNGLLIKKICVPLGVVGIIFESRPNVTSDCAALCFKSGNAVILKGGKEAYYSNEAIFKVMQKVLKNFDMPLAAIQLVPTTDRAAVQELLKLDTFIDVIVPRGGESLIRFVVEHSSIPVIKHYKGVCHVYVSSSANLDMARQIIINAKTQKPGVCNALETLLVHRAVAKRFLPTLITELKNLKCEIRGDQATYAMIQGLKKAKLTDWSTEHLDLILNVKIVDDLNEAICHINQFGSHHSDAIVSNNKNEAKQFLSAVDSACVYINASTRFTDGFEFGFGAEVGISTDKLHVRGPMGLEGLTSYKYQIYGNGQVRE